MRQSLLFTKTRKHAPADEMAKNAILLIRGGFVDKVQAGVYTYLPLGFRVLKNIERVIREEMEGVGAQEILMPSLHPKEQWQKTGRWDTMDDLYKVTDVSGRENALGPTHEEVVTPLAKEFISSYRDLPFAVFQIQNKFRMELRAKSGILRGREFMMKDLYSFHRDEADLALYYAKVREAYERIFTRVGIGAHTYYTFAQGGSFSKYSHEFQTVTPAGEDTIHICDTCKVAVNDEVYKSGENGADACPSCGNKDLRAEKSIETGNIFELKTKFSDAFDVTYKDEKGERNKVVMGCYGIGLGRLMGAVTEVLSDDKGLVWPASIAPFQAHVVALGEGDQVRERADTVVRELESAGVSVLYDDRARAGAGEKFADADLIGIPVRVLISDRMMEKGEVEVKGRTEEEGVRVTPADVLSAVKKYI